MTELILTATVAPNSNAQLHLVDSAARLRQYQQSLAWWARFASEQSALLTVVETSGATFDSLFELAAPETRINCRLVNYQPTPSEVARGKGAMEWAAVRHVISESEATATSGTVYKVTGRLIVQNAAKILTQVPPRTIRARAMLDRSWVDTRVIGASLEVWRSVILGAGDLVNDNDGIYIERALAAETARAAALRQLTIAPFDARPKISGVSGSNGSVYRGTSIRGQDWLTELIERRLRLFAAKKQV